MTAPLPLDVILTDAEYEALTFDHWARLIAGVDEVTVTVWRNGKALRFVRCAPGGAVTLDPAVAFATLPVS